MTIKTVSLGMSLEHMLYKVKAKDEVDEELGGA